MNVNLENCARQGGVIVMAGAGVSAGNPSALPGWKAMNAAIVRVLCRRLESSINRLGWLEGIEQVIDGERFAGHFPPDYQAQLIEEMCGDRYFRALQALDVDVINTNHDGIAALAATGAVRAIVTTNFDRLIERALDKHGINYVVAYDEDGYVKMLQRLTALESNQLPILKIHGCVRDHLSMIDTLKQRKRGRSKHLQACLDTLQSGYWIYLGFSANDLETDDNYLGLVHGAAKSAGATYVKYPRDPNLSEGAKILMHAYGDHGKVVVKHVVAYLDEVCQALGKRRPDPIPDDANLGLDVFKKKLQTWADGLSPAAAGLCLAAILEAIGQAELAVRLLDRLVRKDLHDDQSTVDFRALQLHYGRLGAAWGHFVSVPDLGGAASNISVKTLQSLALLRDSELGFAAKSWLACARLWSNDGHNAGTWAFYLILYFKDYQWEGAQPRSKEEAVDAWLSAAQVLIINSTPTMISCLVDTAAAALDYAKQSCDVVRTARVAALKCLALVEIKEDVPAHLAQHKEDFKEAERVGDNFALGMIALAHGLWLVEFYNPSKTNGADRVMVAQNSLNLIGDAVRNFEKQGMDPWVLFADAQKTKAYAYLSRFKDATDCISNAIKKASERFPILMSHIYEIYGQVQMRLGDNKMVDSFKASLKYAEESDLRFRRESLILYLNYLNQKVNVH